MFGHKSQEVYGAVYHGCVHYKVSLEIQLKFISRVIAITRVDIYGVKSSKSSKHYVPRGA